MLTEAKNKTKSRLPAVFGTTSALSCNKRDERPNDTTTEQNWLSYGAYTAHVSFIWKYSSQNLPLPGVRSVGRSPHLEGYPAERLSVSGDVEVNRGVLVGRRRAAAAHAGGGEGQRTQLDPVRQQQHVAVLIFWLGFEKNDSVAILGHHQ